MNIQLDKNYLNVLGQINLDDLHIKQAFDYYRQRYQQSGLAQQFVKSSCRIDNHFGVSTVIGYCDRTMGKNIPKCRTPEGAAIRGSLQRCGLVRASGHELFRGCIVFPTLNDDGNVISAVGYRFGRIRGGSKAIVYWHKPELKAFVDVGMAFAKELIHAKAYH
jgi:hypothetical protein